MIIQNIENMLFRKVAPFTIRHIKRPNLRSKDQVARKVFDQTAREFQAAPPITLHFPDPLLMAGIWSIIRESFIVNAKERAVHEAVAAAVSYLNECPYCVDVHTAMHASASGNKHLPVKEHKNHDPKVAHAYKWASATLSPQSDDLKHVQIAVADVPQVFGTAIAFHYTNRMVNIFLDKAPMPMPAASSGVMRAFSRASLRFFGKRIVKLDGAPGDFITDPGTIELPSEFSWASSNPNVAGSFIRFAHAAEAAGREALHEDVRSLVIAHLNQWNGEQTDLGRGWLEDLIAPLDPGLKPSAQLALLTARASWQVDNKIISDFKKINPEEKALVQATGWAAFAAVRRISSWLPMPS